MLGRTGRGREPAGFYYWAATFLDCCARSLSITVLHPALKLARCLSMHAVTAETFGMAELQSRKASPVHICCASELKAKPEVDAAQRPAAKATVNPAWRNLFRENEIIASPLF
jgi:hypothetical protein